MIEYTEVSGIPAGAVVNNMPDVQRRVSSCNACGALIFNKELHNNHHQTSVIE